MMIKNSNQRIKTLLINENQQFYGKPVVNKTTVQPRPFLVFLIALLKVSKVMWHRMYWWSRFTQVCVSRYSHSQDLQVFLDSTHYLHKEYWWLELWCQLYVTWSNE